MFLALFFDADISIIVILLSFQTSKISPVFHYFTADTYKRQWHSI